MMEESFLPFPAIHPIHPPFPVRECAARVSLPFPALPCASDVKRSPPMCEQWAGCEEAQCATECVHTLGCPKRNANLVLASVKVQQKRWVAPSLGFASHSTWLYAQKRTYLCPGGRCVVVLFTIAPSSHPIHPPIHAAALFDVASSTYLEPPPPPLCKAHLPSLPLLCSPLLGVHSRNTTVVEKTFIPCGTGNNLT
ncbi:hypothetical protein LZ32DRAFT_54278 [Colletotrichum eremochloae]|nr:hypothetical protein LZ32DRAFT_54278 [Colletotrichum eremochloae]